MKDSQSLLRKVHELTIKLFIFIFTALSILNFIPLSGLLFLTEFNLGTDFPKLLSPVELYKNIILFILPLSHLFSFY